MVFSRATAAAVLGMIATASAEAVQFSIDMCNTAPTTVGVRLNSPGDGNWWEREPIAAVKNDNDNVWTLTSPADTPAGTQYKWIVDGAEDKILDETSPRCKFEYDERNMDALVAVVDATGCLPDNACPSAVPDAPASISFTFNNCGQAGTVGLIVQTDDSENNSGNWWERAPIPLTNTPETDIWTVELPFVGDNAAGNPVSVGLPTAHNRPYKFIVDGSESPVANQDLANNVCQIQYNERKLHYWESPSNYAGCIPDDDGNEACPVSAPDTLTYTFNACSAVETVGYQVATGDVEGVNKVTGGAFHWYERAPYAATNTEGNTWTLTFPLTIGDDTIAVPPIGSTYKILINGAYSEFDDNADLRCHGTYNERKLNVYDAPVDMIGCNTECPTTTPAPAPFEYADHHHCAVKGMKYVNGGDGTAVGRFVATAMDCQDECAAASDTCGFFNYDATAETCTLYDAALLPSGNNWFEEARGILGA